MLFFIIFFVSHSWLGFLIGVGVIVLLSAILRSVLSSSFGQGPMNARPFTQQPYQQPQQPYYQPQQPYYQPYQEPYQPYEQGYQPPPVVNQDAGPQYQYPQPQQPQYDEQPQAQYPQELPPIEQ